MARKRSIRPEYFVHEGLFEIGQTTGLGIYLSTAFAGLWTQADCKGLFEGRPLRLKIAILPWYDIDFAKILAALEQHGFIRGYDVDGKRYFWIVTFNKHQPISAGEWEDGPSHPEPTTFDDYETWAPREPKNPKGRPRGRSRGRSKERTEGCPKDVPEKVPEEVPSASSYLISSSTEEGEARGGAREPGATAPEPPPPSSASPPDENPKAKTRHPVLAEWAEEAAALGLTVAPSDRSDRADADAIAAAEPDPEQRRAVFREAHRAGKSLRFAREDWAKLAAEVAEQAASVARREAIAAESDRRAEEARKRFQGDPGASAGPPDPSKLTAKGRAFLAQRERQKALQAGVRDGAKQSPDQAIAALNRSEPA